MKFGKSIIILASFFLLALSAHYIPYFGFDLSLTRSIQSLHPPFIAWLLTLISELGDDFHFPLVVGGVALLLMYLGEKHESLKIILITIGTTLFGSFIKLLVNRPRPLSSLVLVQEKFIDSSFPSLHVLLFTVFFGYLLYICQKKLPHSFISQILTIFSAAMIASIGYSRIFLGAHWASDVLGGYLLGLIIISYIIPHAKR